MELMRIHQILGSPDEIEVQFQGQKIWIDGVDEYNRTARIHPLDNPGREEQVSVDQLVEIQ